MRERGVAGARMGRVVAIAVERAGPRVAAPEQPGATGGGPLLPAQLLQEWYAANGRHSLPWRLTRDAYAVLVSEVMLQQTQVARVLPYYTAWLRRWPTAAALSGANTADVIRAWAGLGYNRRALYLHRAAVAVMAAGGTMPANEAGLRALPGVGPYTAAAVACFAGEQRAYVADTNIARVLARALLGVAGPREASAAGVRAVGEASLPAVAAREHNLALMDLGAAVCGVRSPACERCPLSEGCAWRAAGYPVGARPARRLPRFETTARFARGRIVDALRGHAALPEHELAERLPGVHAAKLAAYLAALEDEGLIERCGHGWALAGQGSTSMASPKL